MSSKDTTRSMHENFFDYLTAIVNISTKAPQSWILDNSILPFYKNPNSPEWGHALSRVLYHESIHFWQFLASGYLANLINEEWSRILHFEKTNEIRMRSKTFNNYWNTKKGEPFSAYELVECWARYWDVHTRGPHTIQKEERLVSDTKGSLELVRNDNVSYYTSLSFDTVMKKGKDSKFYARPYLWMLEEAWGDTKFINFIFPIIVHNAFGSIEPVQIFCKAFKRAKGSSEIRKLVQQEPQGINQAWLNIWNKIFTDVIYPTIEEAGMPNYTSGFDVIERGRLREHPIYSQYLTEASSLRGHLKMIYHQLKSISPRNEMEKLEQDLVTMPFQDLSSKLLPHSNHFYQLSLLFGLPGQPTYRSLLGEHMAPPRVKFKNFIYNKLRANSAFEKIMYLAGKLEAEPEDDSFGKAIDDLKVRIEDFQKALQIRQKSPAAT